MQFDNGEEVSVSFTVFISTDFLAIIKLYLYYIQIDAPLLGNFSQKIKLSIIMV